MRSVVNDIPEGAATWFSRSICPDTVSDELKEKLIRLQGFYLPTGQKHSLYNKNLNTILPPTQYGIVEFDQDQFVRKLDDVEKKLSYTYHKLLLTKTIPSEEEVENAVQNIVDNNVDIMSKVRMIEKEGIEKEYVYRHCWEEGDVVITDNLRIAHRAPSAAEIKM